ncbi:MAG: hypothetical protein ACOYMY_06660 [Prochlorococcaceae cyanobacterium]
MPGNAPAGPQQLCGDVPGSEVSLGEILEHGFLQFRFCLKPFEAGVLFLQLGQSPGLLGLHPPVLLPPAVVGGLRHLDDATDVGDGLALGDQLLGGLELADDLRPGGSLITHLEALAAEPDPLEWLLDLSDWSPSHLESLI